MSEGGAEGCGRGKRSVWLEEVRDQSWDELMVQSGWGRVCGRVVGGREGGTWSRDGTGPREIGVAGDQQTTIGEENFCSLARARG